MASEPDISSYQAYFDKAPIGIFEVNADGQYVAVNEAACELVGYSEGELLNMTITDLLAEDDGDARPTSFFEVQERGQTRAEETLYHQDGHEVTVILEAAALEDDRYVAYVQDISMEKEYERRLEQQRDSLEVLNQVLRHDVRNDLQLVTAYADFLEQKCEREDTKEYISTIQKSADHVVEITQTAQKIADIMLSASQGEQQINIKPVLEAEIDGVSSSYTAATVACDETVPSVQVQANEMLNSVFRNLLNNAIQHNDKETPEVSVFAAEQADSVVIQFADNGPGIPDTEKEAIFGKGERGLDSSGTGIGLYLVAALVASYGGDVWVEDNDPDGSVFFVELPMAG